MEVAESAGDHAIARACSAIGVMHNTLVSYSMAQNYMHMHVCY